MIKTMAILLTTVSFGVCVTGAEVGQPQGGKLAAGGDTDEFTFVVIGDTRPGARANPDDPASAAIVYMEHILWINRLNSDFNIQVGDLIPGYVDMDLAGKQWDEYDKASKQLEKPYFMVVGNHDVWDAGSAALYNKRYGSLSYSFDHKGCHFTVLSSEMQERASPIGSEQMAWLEKDLAKAGGARQRFIFLHRPMWSYDDRYVADTADFWRDNVIPLLKKYDVDTVFAGHDHHYESGMVDGIRHIITGGGGAELRGWREMGGFYHFLEVSVPREGHPTITVHERDKTFPENIVTAASRHAWHSMLSSFQLSTPIVLGAPRRQRVEFSLQNIFSTPVDIDVAWDAPPESGAMVKPLTRTVHLDPGARENLRFKLSSENADMWSPTADWTVRRPGREAIRHKTWIRSIRAGRYTMGAGSGRTDTRIRVFDLRHVVTGAENWTGEKDASAKAFVVRLDDALVVRVKVIDDILRSDGRYNFQKDSVELYFDLRPEGQRGASKHARGVFQMLVPVDTKAKGPTAVKPQFGNPAAAFTGASAVSTVMPGKGYEIEIVIPFAGLKESHFLPGSEFNFDIGINDSDNIANRDSQLMWSGTGANFRDASSYGKLSRAR
ncbi:MAG: metallophosphoesterase [Lentisphaerae bacterium]|nr:metallophosphoesterase [Lentisphaerota bacterium]